MNQFFRCSLALGLACSILISSHFSSVHAQQPPEPLVPQVAEASDEPQQALESFRYPEGWQAGVWAAEPLVANIVAFTIDNQGRAFVCETFRQSQGVTDNRAHDETWLNADLAAQTVQDRIDYHRRLLGDQAATYEQHDDRIRRLVDTDGDGQADEATVFAARFNRIEEGTGAGVLVRGNEVFYACIPRMWKLIDADGDGRADERIVMSDGYGVRVAFRGHDMHGLILGPDGRLYWSIGDRGYNVTTDEGERYVNPESGAVFRCELDGSNLEVIATGLRNPQELAFDKYGNLFTGDNNSDSGDQARWVYIVRDGDTGWRMHYQYLEDRGPFNREKIWHPFHKEQPAYIVPPIANISDGPSGLVYYPGTGLDDAWQEHFFLADFRGTAAQSGIRAFRVEPNGAFFTLEDASQPVWSILATDVTFGPDGAMYISDWVDGWTGIGKGRIYRFADPQAAATDAAQDVARLLPSDWQGHSIDQLRSLLFHKDQRLRLEAQWELAGRGAREPLVQVASDGMQQTVPRLHGVWGLGQIAREAGDQKRREVLDFLVGLCGDSDPYIRAAAIEVLGDAQYAPAAEQIRAAVLDDSPRVRHFATVAAGLLGDPAAVENVITMLQQNDDADPVLRHAGSIALMRLSGSASSTTAASLTNHDSVPVRRAAVVALRRAADPAVAGFLDDPNPLVVVEAARAIHDLPIPGAMTALAQLLNRPTDDDALLRRALNANFRIGDAPAAGRVAEFAGRSDIDPALRVLAVEALGTWGDPSPRDMVLNAWRPLPGRSADPAVAALKQNLAKILSGPDAIKSRAIEVASAYGISDIVPALVEQVANADASPTLRSDSVDALVKLDPSAARELLESIAGDPSEEVRAAALRAAFELGLPDATDRVIAATKSDSATLRQTGWALLARDESPAATRRLNEGVLQYLAGSLPADSWLEVLEGSQERRTEDVQRALEAADQRWQNENPTAASRWAQAGGDPQRGERLFFGKTELSCVRCHKVGSVGGEVGPDLSTIAAKRDAIYLLESIVDPNAKIAEGFESVLVLDDLGQLFTGVLRSETEDELVLMDVNGKTQTIDKETIVQRKKANSAMPDDLTKFMDRRELRDLVAYLTTLTGPPGSDKEGHSVE